LFAVTGSALAVFLLHAANNVAAVMYIGKAGAAAAAAAAAGSDADAVVAGLCDPRFERYDAFLLGSVCVQVFAYAVSAMMLARALHGLVVGADGAARFRRSHPLVYWTSDDASEDASGPTGSGSSGSGEDQSMAPAALADAKLDSVVESKKSK
jgi:hypothetical protein